MPPADFAEPLRILMLTTFYPPHSFGGDAVSVQRMARALAARGHEVTVVHDRDAFRALGGGPPPGQPAGQPAEPASEPAPDDGVRVIGLSSPLGAVSPLLAQQTGRPVVHGARLRRLVARWRPDILWHNNVSLMGGPGVLDLEAPLRVYEAHEHWLVCPTHVLWHHSGAPCASRDCLRCVLSHRRPPQFWRGTGYLDRQLDKMDLIVAKSRFSRDMHHARGLRHEMEVLPLFLPPAPEQGSELDPGGASDGGPGPGASREGAAGPLHPRPYFLFVGRLEKIKGVQDLIPAMAGQGGADLLIIGGGDHADALARLAGDNPRLHFLGRMPPEALAAYYRDAIALLVPSLCYETFGAILIESFRMGTPVIARRRGPFPEIVEAAGGGLLFDTPGDLAEAMRLLQTDPARRAALSAAARAGFDRHWREDRVLAAWGAALAGAARRKGETALARRLEVSLGPAAAGPDRPAAPRPPAAAERRR